MHIRKLRPPSPALIIACVALFASLGGTGYAATQLASSHGPAARAAKSKPKPAKPLTKSQIQSLIKAYVNAHINQLRGPRGLQGIQGIQGIQGKPGPGAIPFSGGGIGPFTQSAGTIGPWTISLSCTTSSGSLTITGQGTIYGMSVHNGAAAAVGSSSIGSGNTTSLGTNDAVSQQAYLQSGTSVYQLSDFIQSSNSGLFETCSVIGDAIPVT